MYVKLYKQSLKSKKLNSSRVFFPVILYIMMISNFYEVSYFSIGNIMDYFKIPRTTRNLNDIIKCLELMVAEGIIRGLYGIDSPIKMNNLIAYEIIGKESPFVQIQDFEIDKLIDIYVRGEPNYTFAIVFMLLKLNSFTSPSTTNGMAVETTSISYKTIMEQCDIKSTTTMTKYINLMRACDLFTVDEEFDIQDYTDENGNNKQRFKTKYTYYFKERMM